MGDHSYGPSGVFSRRQVRPVPYYTVPGTSSERRLAAAKSEAIRELPFGASARLLREHTTNFQTTL